MPDIVTSQIFTDGEKGITATKLNNVVGGSVIQPDFYTSKPASITLDPADQLLELKSTNQYARITAANLVNSVANQLTLADSTQNGMLRQVSGLTSDVVDGTNHCVNLASMPGITQVRRAFNSIGNSTFEVDNRMAGTLLVNPGSSFSLDRWLLSKNGTLTVSTQQMSAGMGIGGGIVLPGSNFVLTNNFLRITLTAQEATLATGDYLVISQTLEGTRFRELKGDVHSLQFLIRSSVAGFQPGMVLVDSPSAKSLSKLFPTGLVANTWTLVTFPALPIWPSGGNFSSAPGVVGYRLYLSLGCGATYLPNANDTWQNSSGLIAGAIGQGNFAASPVNSTFDIAFVQHEPGTICTAPIDLPFEVNLDDCLRYFDPGTFSYGVKPGTTTGTYVYLSLAANASPYAPIAFKRKMCKVPTITGYSPVTGGSPAVRDFNTNTDRGISSVASISDAGFSGFGLAANTVAWACGFNWVADTGW